MTTSNQDHAKHPAVSLAKQLIACPSIAPEDAGVSQVIGDRLAKAGFEVTLIEQNGVKSLWGCAGNQGPLIVFGVHSDVVPPGDVCDWSSLPFQPEIREGSLYGRGAADMKGPLACALVAAERYLASSPANSLRIGFIVAGDEEPANNHGTNDVLEYLSRLGLQIDYCLVTEPTSLSQFGDTIKVGRRGSINGHLTVHGRQGHAAYPQYAINPVHRALWALHTLTEREWDGASEWFPATGFQITNVSAGTGANNVIPGKLNVSFNLRHGPGLSVSKVEAIVAQAMALAGLQFDLECRSDAEPFLTQGGGFTDLCCEAIRDVSGILPERSTAGGTSDARFIAPHCANLVEFGLVGSSSHHVDEHVSIREMALLTEVYETILQRLSGSHPVSQ